MKKLAFLSIIISAVLLTTICLTGNLYCQENTDILKIGMVDLKKISEKFNKWKRMSGELDKESTVASDRLDAMQAVIKKLQELLENLEPGSKAHKETRDEIEKKNTQARDFYQKEQERLKEKAESLARVLLGNIEDVVQQYGKENNYSFIIKKDEFEDQQQDWLGIRSYVNRKEILYCNVDDDLTEKVIWILNKRFK